MAHRDVSTEASPFGRAQALAGGLLGTLQMARALADVGRRIDLAGLDRLMGLVCAKSLDLSPADGKRMRSLLVVLLRETDLLANSLSLGTAVPRSRPPS
jgi:hypothetical protein